MEPDQDFIIDYYGNKEYVGPDAYSHFHNPKIQPIQPNVQFAPEINPFILVDKTYYSCDSTQNPDYQVDTDYRNLLYNHSMLHYSKGNLVENFNDEILSKKHFSFRNIHQNIGNIL
jgi:hypothetical protein